MEPLRRHPWKLPVLSGVLLAFSYYPLGLVLPNLLAFVPLLVWLDANLDRDWKAWRNAGFVFGATVHLLILNWMLSMLRVSFLAVFAWLGLTFLFAVGISAAFVALCWTRKHAGWPLAVLLPACWISLEWVQAQGDLRMTAQHLGQTLATIPFLCQFDDLLGPYGVGLALLLSSALLHEAWRASSPGRRKAALGAWAGLLAAIVAYDAWAWSHPPRATGTVRVALVQPNVPLAVKLDNATDAAQAATMIELTRKAAAAGARVVVWPETAWPHALMHDPSRPETFALPVVQRLARETGVTIVAGVEYYRARERAAPDAYNAAVVAHPDGTLDPTWAAKIVLVPFVEAVPFRAILGPVLSGRGGWMRWLGGGFLPGPKATPLPVVGSTLGITVCYEELFFDLQRDLKNAGAAMQAVITNDAWFGRAYFQPYQANTVRLRAIENRTSFVRAANTGISMFVDPMGRDLVRTPLEVQTVETADLPLVAGRTVYDRVGNVVAWASLATLAAAALTAWRRTR